jgi:hypothetical protein
MPPEMVRMPPAMLALVPIVLLTRHLKRKKVFYFSKGAQALDLRLRGVLYIASLYR